MSPIHLLLLATGALLLSACGTMNTSDGASKGAISKGGPAEQKLSSGIKNYNEDDFKASIAALQGALDLGLSSKGDQVSAHKYLAFIYCVSKREKQCRAEFRKALEINPAFDLQPAEAGHPLWGSVFRSEKAKYAAK